MACNYRKMPEAGLDGKIYMCMYIHMKANTILFQALGDPRRLRIVEVLRGGEQSVGQISAHMGIAQSGVSRHLRILAESGVVKARAAGQERIYALQPTPFAALGDWAAQYQDIWSGRLDRMAGALAARQLRGDDD